MCQLHCFCSVTVMVSLCHLDLIVHLQGAGIAVPSIMMFVSLLMRGNIREFVVYYAGGLS